MPELPEVETVRIGLAKKIIGSKIKDLKILTPKSFQGDAKLVIGAKIIKVWRRAKLLGIELSAVNNDQHTLLFHLKMSGQIILSEGQNRLIGGHPTKDMFSDLPNQSTRVIFELDNYTLYFNDQRKFGWIKALNPKSLILSGLLKKLGPEPLAKDFSWQVLKSNLSKHKSLPIKVALLDQTIISGLGNIYACEACFLAKINPLAKTQDLTDSQFKKLHQAIIDSLNLAIKKGGSTLRHFTNQDGQKGTYLDYAYVYGRLELPCKICQTKIAKIKLAGRGTYFCPNCQRKSFRV